MDNKGSHSLINKFSQILRGLKKQPLLLITLAAICLQALIGIYTLRNPNTMYTTDSYEYLQAADNVRHHFLLYAGDVQQPINPALYSRRPPLYPIFILLSTLLFKNYYIIFLFQVVLYLLNLLLLWKILSCFRLSSTTKNLILFLYLLYPSHIIYTHMIMSEMLLQTFLLWALLQFLQFQLTHQLKHLLWYNIAVSLAVLTKPILLYFWIPNLILHLWLFIRDRRKQIIIISLLFIFTISSWSMRNYLHTGYFHYSSIKNFNLLYYNTHSFLTHKYGSEQAEKFILELESKTQPLNFAESNRFIEKSCFAVISANIIDYSLYHLRGAFFFFIDPGRYDIYQFLGLSAETGFFHLMSRQGLVGILNQLKNIPPLVIGYLFLIASINILLFISLMIFILKGRLLREIKWFMVGIIFYFALMVGPLGASRLRMPVIPYLMITVPILFQRKLSFMQFGDNTDSESASI